MDEMFVLVRENEKGIQLRRNEKKILNEINADKDGRLRFHILGDKGKKKKRIQTREEKIYILANDSLTGDPSAHDLSLIQDMNSICSNGCRIAKCMKDYFIYKKNYKGAMNASLLAKSFDQRLWDDSPYLLKQLPGIGMVTAKALHSMGIKSFEALAEADPRRIEIVTGRKYPFGNHIKDSLLSLPPKIDMKLEEIERQKQGKCKLVVTLTRMSESVQSVKRHYADMIIGVEEDNIILFHEKISPYSATILVPMSHRKQIIKANFVHEEYIGIDVHQNLSLIQESNSNVQLQRNRKLPAFPSPEEVHVIEDDNIFTPQMPMEEPCNLKSQDETDSIPNFNLLNDELGEGGCAPEVEEDECKIINEKTVFDHIREKAKKFSLLSAYDNIRLSSPEVLLTRKRAREKRAGLPHEVIVLDDETERLNISPQAEVHFPVGPRKEEDDDRNLYLNLKDHNAVGSSNAIGDAVDTGIFLTEPEASTYETSTYHTIFDHIRRKSKDFPLLGNLDCVKSISQKKELFTNNHFDSLNAASDTEMKTNVSNSVKENIPTSYMESVEVEKHESGFQYGTDMEHDKFEDFSGKDGESCVLKDNKRPLDASSFAHNIRKKHRSAIESEAEKSSLSETRGQCCFMEPALRMKEVGSSPVFRSVFSFL